MTRNKSSYCSNSPTLSRYTRVKIKWVNTETTCTSFLQFLKNFGVTW